jgi:hypothetical protein
MSAPSIEEQIEMALTSWSEWALRSGLGVEDVLDAMQAVIDDTRETLLKEGA